MSVEDRPSRTILVLAEPDDPSLGVLARLPLETTAVVGTRLEEVRVAAGAAEVIVHASAPAGLLEEVWPHTKGVRWVHSRSAGVDHLLFPALMESDVPLTNARGVFSRALAEFVMAGVLFFAKDIRRLLAAQSERRWEAYEPDAVHGRTMVIVGFGDIGRATARLAKSFGMRVVGVRRTEPGADGLADEVIATSGLERALARADVLVLAAPLTPDTRGMIGGAQLAALPPHCVVVNVGRGPVLDEAALIDALRARRIRGAALDVFETEPLPPDHPLWAQDNLLICPHSADHTAGWREEAMELFLDNLRRYLAGEELRNVVNKRRGY